jgi:predicted RNA-binding protein Jag
MEKPDSIERLANSVEEATAEALKILNVSQNEVIITVLDEGSKGAFLGIGKKPARVRVELKPDPVEAVKIFLREVTLSMGLSVRRKHGHFNRKTRTNPRRFAISHKPCRRTARRFANERCD